MFMSIDQSFTSTGYCVFDDDCKLVDFGLIKSVKADDIFSRANYVAQQLSDIARHADVTYTAIEGLAYGSTGNNTRDLGGLQFTIILKIRAVNGFDTTIVAPTSVVKFGLAAGGVERRKGVKGKILLIEALPDNIRQQFDNYGVKKTTGLTDLTDAYWIGRYLYENEIRKHVGTVGR